MNPSPAAMIASEWSAEPVSVALIGLPHRSPMSVDSTGLDVSTPLIVQMSTDGRRRVLGPAGLLICAWNPGLPPAGAT